MASFALIRPSGTFSRWEKEAIRDMRRLSKNLLLPDITP